LAQDRQPKVLATIPDAPERHPETVEHDPANATLLVGDGRIGPVTAAAWEYETSGYKLVRRWFNKRKREPEGRKSSPLDDVVARGWDPAWTTELLEMLNVIELLVELEPDQDELLERIVNSPLISAADLTSAGVPAAMSLRPELPPKQIGQL